MNHMRRCSCFGVWDADGEHIFLKNFFHFDLF